jgi:LysR family transcriptional activator of nhaA
MEWLNYHHLYYFTVIVQEGGVARAARKLRLTHSTLSAQLRTLENHFGWPLFERRGKRLVLTPFGSDVSRYATDIFRLGRELDDFARERAGTGLEVLRVGVVAGLPKTLVHNLLTPALDGNGTVLVRQDTSAALFEQLISGRLHVVLMNDVPTAPALARVNSYALGETDILLYARAQLAQAGRRSFPESLADVPFVLPPVGAPLRRRLDVWFAQRGLRVPIKAEVEDAGLMRVFGCSGRGVFPVRAALKAEVEDLREVELVGVCEDVRETYYAITSDRRIGRERLTALIDGARTSLNPLRPSDGVPPRPKKTAAE